MEDLFYFVYGIFYIKGSWRHTACNSVSHGGVGGEVNEEDLCNKEFWVLKKDQLTPI